MSRVSASEASARLTRISAALKAAGDRENLNALRRGLRAGAAPLIPAVQEAARRQLPKAGGLNELVASRRVSVNSRLAGRSAAVLLRSTKSGSNEQTNSGYVRHPVFGRRGSWVQENIPNAAGWWTETLTRESPKVREALEAAIDAQAARLNDL